MTADIVAHRTRRPMPRGQLHVLAGSAMATIRRQQIEALPKVDGHLWARLSEHSEPCDRPTTPLGRRLGAERRRD